MRFCKTLFSFVFFVQVFAFLVNDLRAADVAFSGYFRSRGNFHYNLDLNRDQSPEVRGFTDLRFRLDPTVYVTDKVRIYSSLNFVDGQLGSQPNRLAAFSNPAQSNDRTIDINETESVLGRSDSTAELSPYGGIYVGDGLVQSAGLSAVQLRRAWAEIDTPFGILKVGRMPFQLGLGIFANAGDQPDQEVGTTRDRIVFDTNFGPYYVRPGLGWLIEGALDRSADDFMEYFFLFGKKNDDQHLSMFISYNSQKRYSPSAAVTTTSNLANRGTGYWAFDFFAENKFNSISLAAEVAVFSGKIMGRDLLAINSALQTRFDWAPYQLLVEAGYSSGTSASNSSQNELRTVAFSRDYDVALILFEEALPGGATQQNSTGTVSNSPTAPHSGALSNAIYPRVKLSYDAASFFKPALNVIAPFAAQKAIGGDGKVYGVEYDILTYWPLSKHLTGEFSFGHFIPGSFYHHVSKSQSTFLVRGGIVASF